MSPAGTWAPAGGRPPRDARDPLRGFVLGIDEWLRRSDGVIEFSDDPRCMLRVGRNRAERQMTLGDGVVVAPGDPILELHFWNERLPQAAATQGLGWGGRFGRQLIRSLGQLADAIGADPRLSDAVAIHGRLAFAAARNRDEMRRFAHWFGMETPAEPARLPLVRRLHDAAEDFWLLGLSYAFNPGCLRGRQVARRRDDLWISKAALVTRYGARRQTPA